MNESATTLHEMSLISQIIDYYKSELKKIEDTCDITKKIIENEFPLCSICYDTPIQKLFGTLSISKVFIIR
jgi:hypothetical protein